MDYRFDSYCGLYCGACDVLQANLKDRHEEMAAKLGNTKENFTCHGCKTKNISEWCGKCSIRSCAIDNNVEYCIECSKFPCDDWTKFSNDSRFLQFHRNALPNMEMIKQDGLQHWLEQQREKWRCNSCNAVIAWTDTSCRQCGSLLNYKK